MQTSKAKQMVLSLLTIFLWASCYVAIRMGSKHYSPFALTSLRFFASAATVLVMLPFRKLQRPALRDLPLFLLSALSAYSLYCCIMALGARTVTASVSSFVMAFAPVMTPMFALLLLQEHMSRRKWISLVISGCGVVVLLFTDSSFSIELGIVWVLLGAILFALYNIVQRILLRRYDSFVVTAYSTLLGAFTLLPFAPTAFSQMKTAPMSATLILCYLGAVSVIAYLFWAMALKLAQHTSEVTNFMFLTPIITTVLGFFTIGEMPPPSAILGGVLLLLGLLLTNLEPKKENRQNQDQITSDSKEELPF